MEKMLKIIWNYLHRFKARTNHNILIQPVIPCGRIRKNDRDVIAETLRKILDAEERRFKESAKETEIKA